MYLHVSVGIVSVSACICWGYVDACFPRGICDCAGRPGSGSPPWLLQPPARRRPGPDTRSEPGSGSPLFYINTWAGVLQPPVLHQHVGHDLAHWLLRVGGDGALKKIKSFDYVNWKCVLHRPYPHHGQPGSLTDSLSASGAPLAYPQADIPVHTCRYKQMPWHTCRYRNRYIQIQIWYIWYIQIREILYALYVRFTFLYVSCMCMYDVCIRRLKRVIHTTYRHINQSICVCMCMYLHVCGTFFVYV